MNITNLKISETAGKYNVVGDLDINEIIALAQKLASHKLRKGAKFNSPCAVVDYLRMIYSTKEHEEFAIIYLDTQNRVIELEILFNGTIATASVYPREIVKSVLNKNAASVILCHNHPSGLAEPSRADEVITTKIQNALRLIDVDVLDHIIVGTDNTVSFAERGKL